MSQKRIQRQQVGFRLFSAGQHRHPIHLQSFRHQIVATEGHAVPGMRA